MKRFALGIAFVFGMAVSAFAQNDLQPLAVVKLSKPETITVKTLKARVNFVLKQYEPYGMTELSLEQKKEVLENLITEKLINQAAAKDGLSISDSQVNEQFLKTFSQQLGQNVTEAQLNDLIKQRTGKSLDEYLKENSGMNTAEYKAYLKNQIIAQQYVIKQKRDAIAGVQATDEEIRKAYEMNKATFVWNDMVRLFLVMVPKDSDAANAKKTAMDLRASYEKNPATAANDMKNSDKNGTAYRAGDIIVQKTSQQAQQLGWNYDKILELFGKETGYLSELTETDRDFQFYAVLKKYDARMLGISDVVQPESNVTVYEYIKENLTSQKQNQYFSQAAKDVGKELDTAANVERKKTGEALDKLLDW